LFVHRIKRPEAGIEWPVIDDLTAAQAILQRSSFD
jgi:hypothetical protein